MFALMNQQVHLQNIIACLRENFCRAISEIKTLQAQKSALEDQIDVLTSEQKNIKSQLQQGQSKDETELQEELACQKESWLRKEETEKTIAQLQQELKEKNQLLTKVVAETEVCIQAHMDCLNQSNGKELELKSQDKRWRPTCKALEAKLQEDPDHKGQSWDQTIEHLDEQDQDQDQNCINCLKKEKEREKKDKEIEHLKSRIKYLEVRQRIRNGFESQLQHNLKEKDNLLQKAIIKRQARTKAHVDCLHQLSKTEVELKCKDEQWRAKYSLLEASFQKELAQRNKSQSLKVQEVQNKSNSQSTERLKKEEEWKQRDNEKVIEQLRQELREKDELLTKATTKRQACTQAYRHCQHQLTGTKRELGRKEEQWKAKYDLLEASFQEELAQREKYWNQKMQEVQTQQNLHPDEKKREPKQRTKHFQNVVVTLKVDMKTKQGHQDNENTTEETEETNETTERS